MPKRWSIQLTLQSKDESGSWVDEPDPYNDVSREYPDDQEPKVRKKRDRIKKKADEER
jgi:hypothetical protein